MSRERNSMLSPIDPRMLISTSQPIDPGKKINKHDPVMLKKLCQDFEAVLFNSMLKSMRKTIPEGGLFPKNNAHKIYQEMLDVEISNSSSRNQSIGIADMMYRQLQRQSGQEE